MRFHARPLPAALSVLVLCAALTSCGGSSEGTATSTSAPETFASTTDATDGDVGDDAATVDTSESASASLPPSDVEEVPSSTEPVPTVAATVPVTVPVTRVEDPPADEPISEFDALLLTGEDVGPGWVTSEISEYTASSEMDVEACPAVVAINEVDRYLVTQVEIIDADFNAVNSAIGRAASSAAAAEIVSQFSEIYLCDTTDLFGTGDATGGVLDVPGATAASVLRLTSDEGEFVELAVVSVDDLVLVVGVFWDEAVDLSGLIDQLAATAVQKVAAA